METTRHWLVIGQQSKRRLGVFFSEKFNFFQLKKTLWAAEKDAGGGVLKCAQDFYENTVYSIEL